ncbi:cystatin-A-like [Thunnus maccoyii]|uniref:cystatin-A-like n=1 Tax=Thunnus maccoyii TaxID=8240 RepID=UPI001C4C0E6C|nr:cystatin-A-like [Thunnus maccoyii]
MSVPGAFSETKDATKETQKLCDQVKPQVEVKTGKKFKEFVAVNYSDQIVAGRNFLIKVHVGDIHYIILHVFQALDGAVELKGALDNCTKDNPLVPFLN